MSLPHATLRSLKYKFPTEVIINRRVSSESNKQTGVVTNVEDSYKVKRAIVLPVNTDRDFIYALTFIASNKNFTYGGFFEQQRVQVYIDGPDMVVPIEIDHWLTIGGRRFEVEAIVDYVPYQGMLIRAKQVTTVSPERILKETLWTRLRLTSNATATVG